jgi:hypothetical protein
VARGSVVGYGSILRAGRSQIRIPIRSLDFSIDLTLPSALRSRGSTRNLPGGKRRPARMADNLTAICKPSLYTRPGFKPGFGHVGFCDGQKWRWDRFSPRTSVSPANLHSICFSTVIFTFTRGWHNRTKVAAVPIASQTKLKKNVGTSMSHNSMGIHGLLQE